MKKNILAVCDTESGYACNFAEYMNRRKRLPFEAEAFTDVERLREYAGENPLEILMIAEADMDASVEEIPAEKLIILSEDKKKERGNHRCIYKYQSVECIVREVMEYCAQTQMFSAACSAAEAKMQIIGVYSPAGRCGKTMFALTAGQILAQDREVLYVSMEDYSGFEELFERSYEKNLGDMVYAMRSGKINPVWKLESMTEKMGKLSYLPPAQSPEDVRNIKFQEWMKIFQTVRESRKYEVLILDIGNGTDQLFQMIDLCSRVYMPVLTDKISVCKICRFETLWQMWAGEKEEKRIRKLNLPPVPDTESADFPDSLLWGKWGNYVGKVLREDDTVLRI